MDIRVERTDYAAITTMHDLHRAEASCQIVRDSILKRGLADAYAIRVDGRLGGHGGVWNKYDPGRVMEFYTVPSIRAEALPMFRALVAAAGATHVEAQTNMPLMLLMLYDCAADISVENFLFHDAITTNLACPDAVFRRATPQDKGSIPEQRNEPVGDWLLEVKGDIVGTGGFLCHYNPPYGDIYMEIAATYRGKGYGSYLVQELKRACYEAGKRPAARCDPGNVASRRTLQRAGLLPCARILTGRIVPEG
jgi:GNAT superfamily N-acetyltransferase